MPYPHFIALCPFLRGVSFALCPAFATLKRNGGESLENLKSNPHHFLLLRDRLFKSYPAILNTGRHPWQILWFPFLLGGIIALSISITQSFQSISLLGLFALSIALGIFYASLGLFTHELLHGSIMKINALTQSFAWCGFFIFGLSPELWLTWHNRIHHFYANTSSKDPDTFGLWSDFQKFPMQDFILKRAPGSKHLWAWIYLPINFSNQAMTVMWYFLWKGDPKLFAPVRKGVALFETLLMYSVWAAVFVLLGWKIGVLILLIPALVANLIASSYILVQHLFMPLTDENLPLENTLGVSTLAPLDLIHFNFGHHVEHHVFPEINHQHLPEIRALLQKEFPAHYRMMSHARALKILMTSPRVYENHHTLYDPHTGRRMDVSDMGRKV